MKNKNIIIILTTVIILLVILGAYRLNNAGANVKSLGDQLYIVKDSLENLEDQYTEIHAQYKDIREELDRTKSKLYFIKAELDTMTSRRMSNYTEVHSRLIELKLKLGKIHTIPKDSTQFRFE